MIDAFALVVLVMLFGHPDLRHGQIAHRHFAYAVLPAHAQSEGVVEHTVRNPFRNATDLTVVEYLVYMCDMRLLSARSSLMKYM